MLLIHITAWDMFVMQRMILGLFRVGIIIRLCIFLISIYCWIIGAKFLVLGLL